MDNQSSVSEAWSYVHGFDVPVLTPELRDAWRRVIDKLTPEQFRRGAQRSRNRPVPELKFRPSVQAFLGYALGASDEPPRVQPFTPQDDPENVAPRPDAIRQLQRLREQLRGTNAS